LTPRAQNNGNSFGDGKKCARGEDKENNSVGGSPEFAKHRGPKYVPALQKKNFNNTFYKKLKEAGVRKNDFHVDLTSLGQKNAGGQIKGKKKSSRAKLDKKLGYKGVPLESQDRDHSLKVRDSLQYLENPNLNSDRFFGQEIPDQNFPKNRHPKPKHAPVQSATISCETSARKASQTNDSHYQFQKKIYKAEQRPPHTSNHNLADPPKNFYHPTKADVSTNFLNTPGNQNLRQPTSKNSSHSDKKREIINSIFGGLNKNTIFKDIRKGQNISNADLQMINNYADNELMGHKKGWAPMGSCVNKSVCLGGSMGNPKDQDMYNMFFDRQSVYHPDCLSNILGVRDS
jgi:hypothetical protein